MEVIESYPFRSQLNWQFQDESREAFLMRIFLTGKKNYMNKKTPYSSGKFS